jgi:hypothetical protein
MLPQQNRMQLLEEEAVKAVCAFEELSQVEQEME